jgi:hypothetical protein
MPLINITNSFLIVLGFTIISFTSCKDQKTDQKKLQAKVMSVHDSLMMDMGKLTENRMTLTKIFIHLDSLKKVNADLDTVQIKTEITDLKIALSNTDDAMMKWMNDFKPDYTGKSEKEIVNYLQHQKIKIDSVKTLFNQSLSKSDSLIFKLK